MTAKYNEGNKGKITDTTKVTIYCQIYKRVCKVRGGYIWIFSQMFDVGSRVVECSWSIVAGS